MVGEEGRFIQRQGGFAANGSGGKGLFAEHLVTNPQWLSTKVVGGKP
jgi:hypothetical protein